jgi:hypothetical protein
MRKVTAIVLTTLCCAMPAAAQTTRASDDSHKFVKVVVGVGALAIGTVVAAKSSETTTVTNALGTSETSSHSTSQLVTGLVIVGAGGFLLWDGLRDHGPARPSTAFGVAAGRKAGSLFVRRSW